MKKRLINRISFFLLLICPILNSCFTGIESTKKIKLTHEQKNLTKPTEEELFFSGIKGQPVSEWEEGHRFFVSDNKAILIFEPGIFFYDTTPPEIGGDTIIFDGVESRIDAAGNITMVINFKDRDLKLPYLTGKPFDVALDKINSDQIPMLIDLNIVDDVRNLLQGKKLWTRTLLNYDSIGSRVKGKKFIEVEVIDVEPGNMVFPLKIKLKDNDGNISWQMMNAGNSGNESRSFNHLFTFTDPRTKFSSISDENWYLICMGDVKLGMTKEECRLSLGMPSDVSSGHDYSQTLDVWNYENGIILWFEDGLLTRMRK